MRLGLVGGVLLGFSMGILACPVEAQSAKDLPVREITVFKDGHAFVLKQGKVPVESGGTARLTSLPNPVLGTFFPYASGEKVTLTSVTAYRQISEHSRPASSREDYLRANIGMSVVIERIQNDPQPISGTIKAVQPELPLPDVSEPLSSVSNRPNPYNYTPLNSAIVVPRPEAIVVVQTSGGLVPLPITQIYGLTLRGEAKSQVKEPKVDNELLLTLSGAMPGQDVELGVMYLERGVRWIPHYKVSLDGKGKARILLQATLINDLLDLNSARVNLVVGVPKFDFSDSPDPIGLQDTFARLSRYFSSDSPTAQNFSNAIMGQAAYANANSANPNTEGSTGSEISNAERNEDLFVFSLDKVTLKKGQRMTLPVTEVEIAYKDVYTLEIPALPPLRSQYYYDFVQNAARNRELSKLLEAPKVMHQIRLCNTSKFPLTTAPALLLREGKVISQSLMKYTSVSGESDLPLTSAMDVLVKRKDTEQERIPNALVVDNVPLSLIKLNGTLDLTNYRKEPIFLEITRSVIGNILSANADGVTEVLDPYSTMTNSPEYLGYRYGELGRYNGLGQARWKATLEPGKTLNLTYQWQYYVR